MMKIPTFKTLFTKNLPLVLNSLTLLKKKEQCEHSAKHLLFDLTK